MAEGGTGGPAAAVIVRSEYEHPSLGKAGTGGKHGTAGSAQFEKAAAINSLVHSALFFFELKVAS